MRTEAGHSSKPLWGFGDLVSAAGGTPDGAPVHDLRGFSIDSRAIAPGDVFIALKDKRDGHDFVSAAFAAGAAAAIVEAGYRRKAGDGALVRVPDTLDALRSIGSAARARLSPDARVIAVTGSSGKTTTKDLLRTALANLGATHAAEKSFNNHWGVPLTLARMPADTRYAVIEIGMNHSGEITPLTRLVRPHVAVVLNVLPAHLGNFNSEDEIAEAKAEIFQGLEPGGVAIINRDSKHYALLRARAETSGASILTFGGEDADARLKSCGGPAGGGAGQEVLAELPASGGIDYELALSGRHIAENSVAALLAIEAAGGDVRQAASALSRVKPSRGRGERTTLGVPGGSILIIDESYNANPASMAAAIRTAGQIRAQASGRLILALGEMLELGAEAEALHRGLSAEIDAAGVDLVFACGPNMGALFRTLPEGRRGHWADKSDGLSSPLLAALKPGDIVMVKGSNASGMATLVAALKERHTALENRV